MKICYAKTIEALQARKIWLFLKSLIGDHHYAYAIQESVANRILRKNKPFSADQTEDSNTQPQTL